MPIVQRLASKNMYDNENTVQKSFDTGFLTEELLQAQWAEFIELKKNENKKKAFKIIRYQKSGTWLKNMMEQTMP